MCDSEGHMSDAFAAVQRRSWLVLQLGEQSIGPNPPPGREEFHPPMESLMWLMFFCVINTGCNEVLGCLVYRWIDTSDMAATTPKIQTLRCLIREIRRTLLPHENLRHSPAFEYMMKEYRHNAVTDQQCCRQQEEMAYLAHTCATYLEISRTSPGIPLSG
ncbi:uncharacterized protein LOC123499227 isoform X2 [Portunus trituberculatus]|uniref:uncharacterized protein LOC123499227 isoform X2 n=1 Tax=Portunus trituberculatus TaxID=210409 RepID=UPI001E1CDF39|nr:uncharacterized protein LOC123499227 isoform X2 [Portunus trituberculatus]